MTDPHSAIPEYAQPQLWRRYENWRAGRYERLLAKNASKFPRLRNRRSFRRLVGLLIVFLIVLTISAVIAFFSSVWFVAPYLASLFGILATLSILKVVTGAIADAPVSALDEIQLAQRNSARSIGYIVLYTLTFIPFMFLILMGSAFEKVSGQNVYGVGVVLVTIALIGSCTPTILTSWWLDDPDPEDYLTSENTEPVDLEQPEPEPDPELPTDAATTLAAIEPASDRDPPAPARW
ncbi:hypothetical protein ACQ7HM_10785 [Williamsia sp. MIQD14]|uniref:hypothetical protein n=1 Tax=Williamsia sp. MIQD14 TaxID=3425703 RepID=UPI003DA079F2